MRLDLGRVGDERLYIAGEDLGQGPAVLLLHGWPGSSRIWDDLRAQLLAQGFRVITYDRRGCGRSGHPSGGYDLDSLAEDLARVMGLLDLQDACAVAWDFGCLELMRLLAGRGEGRIARAALIAPPQRSALWLSQTRRALEEDRFQALESLIDEGFACSVSEQRTAARRAWWLDACTTAPHALLATLSAHEDGLNQMSDDCARIHIPTLVISGADPLGSVQAPLPDLALARHHIIKGGSRFLLATHRAELEGALLTFLTQPT